MQLRERLIKTLFPRLARVTGEFTPVSTSLEEKRLMQLEWMSQRGIDITLKDSERPRPPARKTPGPGSVIRFSGKR